MEPKYLRLFTLDDVGCHADAIHGPAHVRERLAQLCESILLPELAATLRAVTEYDDPSDVEQDAIDALNEQCANTVHFEMVAGDVILFETELDSEDMPDEDDPDRKFELSQDR